MWIVGITGGIATGKSTTSRIISEAGYPVIDADLFARKVVEPGTQCLKDMIQLFGPEILTPEGTLNRPKLASIVFQNSELRKKLNQLTHPRILRDMAIQVLIQLLLGKTVCFLDIPLLFESHLESYMTTVLVYVPKDIQKERLMKRDALTEQEAQQRLDAQMDIELKKSKAHLVLSNRHSELQSQIDQLLKRAQYRQWLGYCLYPLLFPFQLMALLGLWSWKQINP
jgi:dephospho-CoA kinase